MYNSSTVQKSILTVSLGCAIVASALASLLASGCGSSNANSDFNPGGGLGDATADGAGHGDSGNLIGNGDGGSGPDAGAGTVLSSVHIVPANASIVVQGGQTATQAYKVMGLVDGSTTETDVTSRFVFWVPDNYLVGDFPANGGPLFTTRLPSASSPYPQQGGMLTVEAEALNPGNVKVFATTTLTVTLIASISYPDEGPDGGLIDSGLPANVSTLFNGPADPTRAPVLEYPNNATMLPPNLHVLDVHWMPGSAANTLFKINFKSTVADITYYTACGNLNGLMVAGACGFELDSIGYGYLAQSNAGAGNVALTIQGTDAMGTGVGTSATFQIQFAQQPVNGGVYYWDVTNTQIMRFDFGGTATSAQVFLQPGEYGTNGTCIGCHALSPDGTKMAASAGGQGNGLLEYVNDIATIGDAAHADRRERRTASSSPRSAPWVTSSSRSTGTGSRGATRSRRTTSGSTTARPGHHPAGEHEDAVVRARPPRLVPRRDDDRDDARRRANNTSQREYLGGIDVATFAAGSVTDAGVNVGANGASLADPVVDRPEQRDQRNVPPTTATTRASRPTTRSWSSRRAPARSATRRTRTATATSLTT
jgi:hypothetical protein